MLSDPTLLTFLLIVNLIALGMTWLAWKRPTWGRILFALNFLGAGLFNWVFLILDPEEYLYYSEFVLLESYRQFILGPFAEHLFLFLSLISGAQLLIGVALLSRGALFQVGTVAAMIFLIAIAPFGIGAAFPATLIQSLGLFLLLRRGATESVVPFIRSRMTSRKKARGS